MNDLYKWFEALCLLSILAIVIILLVKQERKKKESFNPTTGTQFVIFQKVNNDLGISILTDLMRMTKDLKHGSGLFKGTPVKVSIDNNTLKLDQYSYPLTRDRDIASFMINNQKYYLAPWSIVQSKLFPYGKVTCSSM